MLSSVFSWGITYRWPIIEHVKDSPRQYILNSTVVHRTVLWIDSGDNFQTRYTNTITYHFLVLVFFFCLFFTESIYIYVKSSGIKIFVFFLRLRFLFLCWFIFLLLLFLIFLLFCFRFRLRLRLILILFRRYNNFLVSLLLFSVTSLGTTKTTTTWTLLLRWWLANLIFVRISLSLCFLCWTGIHNFLLLLLLGFLSFSLLSIASWLVSASTFIVTHCIISISW